MLSLRCGIHVSLSLRCGIHVLPNWRHEDGSLVVHSTYAKRLEEIHEKYVGGYTLTLFPSGVIVGVVPRNASARSVQNPAFSPISTTTGLSTTRTGASYNDPRQILSPNNLSHALVRSGFSVFIPMREGVTDAEDVRLAGPREIAELCERRESLRNVVANENDLPYAIYAAEVDDYWTTTHVLEFAARELRRDRLLILAAV